RRLHTDTVYEDSADPGSEHDRALESDDDEAAAGLEPVGHPMTDPGVDDNQPGREEETPHEHGKADAKHGARQQDGRRNAQGDDSGGEHGEESERTVDD